MRKIEFKLGVPKFEGYAANAVGDVNMIADVNSSIRLRDVIEAEKAEIYEFEIGISEDVKDNYIKINGEIISECLSQEEMNESSVMELIKYYRER